MADLNDTLRKIAIRTGPIIAAKAAPLAGAALEVAWTGITTAATVVAPLAPVAVAGYLLYKCIED